MAGLNGTAKAVPLQRPIFETSSRAERALAIYKRWISPLFPAACRYVPTCSEYAAEAVARYGVLRGGAMALGRVLRCHPLGGAGHDPVADIAEFRNFETTVRQTHHHETTKRIVIPSEARLSYAKESEPRDLGLESLSGELRRAKCTIPTQTGTKIQARAPSTRFARSGFRLAARTPPKRLKLGMTSF